MYVRIAGVGGHWLESPVGLIRRRLVPLETSSILLDGPLTTYFSLVHQRGPSSAGGFINFACGTTNDSTQTIFFSPAQIVNHTVRSVSKSYVRNINFFHLISNLNYVNAYYSEHAAPQQLEMSTGRVALHSEIEIRTVFCTNLLSRWWPTQHSLIKLDLGAVL